MRIAVTYENGGIGQHFGRTEQFEIYDVKDGEVIGRQLVGTNGASHGALAGFLKEAQVDSLICGGIGMGARNALAATGIALYPGVSGVPEEAVKRLLANELDYDPDTACKHHDHEHGEGHECHSGACGGHGA